MEIPFHVVGWVGPNNHVLWAYTGSRSHAGRGNFCTNAAYRENALPRHGSSQIILEFFVMVLVEYYPFVYQSNWYIINSLNF